MRDEDKTKEELIEELQEMRRRFCRLSKSEVHGQTSDTRGASNMLDIDVESLTILPARRHDLTGRAEARAGLGTPEMARCLQNEASTSANHEREDREGYEGYHDVALLLVVDHVRVVDDDGYLLAPHGHAEGDGVIVALERPGRCGE